MYVQQKHFTNLKSHREVCNIISFRFIMRAWVQVEMLQSGKFLLIHEAPPWIVVEQFKIFNKYRIV